MVLKVNIQMDCVSQDSPQKSLFFGKLQSWDQTVQSSSRRPRCVTQKFGNERFHRMQKCIPQEGTPWAPKFEDRTQDETLKQERCDENTFNSPPEAWVILAPSSTKPEEREFVIDSGASMHMLRKKTQAQANWKLFEDPGTPITVVTANGEVQTKEEAQVYVHDLELFVTVQILEDTLAVLSLGKLCEKHGYTFERDSGQKPHLTKDGKNIRCKTETYVPLVVPGHHRIPARAPPRHRRRRIHRVH